MKRLPTTACPRAEGILEAGARREARIFRFIRMRRFLSSSAYQRNFQCSAWYFGALVILENAEWLCPERGCLKLSAIRMLIP